VRPIAFVVLANVVAALTHHKQVPVVLGVEPALHIDRERRIRRSDREIGEELEFRSGKDTTIALIEDVDVAVLALDVHVAFPVNGGRIHTPLKAIGMHTVI
jgi:hypothetical protein